MSFTGWASIVAADSMGFFVEVAVKVTWAVDDQKDVVLEVKEASGRRG